MPPIAVIFDVDGVLVASPHERAWQEALASLVATEWRALAADPRLLEAVVEGRLAGAVDGAGTALADARRPPA
jgi:beta-phosphoglucomutase-like phosphatase (HAD superfamily)